ncbi:MauE/DoxX family redox-associated membrane protein [Nonomuraea sp. NPDC050310]|uniref:MauE/DoxX family redox-associated membrane protein n=1 Tax=Nonomuraea sp. NPDC050310 TaxID=3154935 RepID=UPI0033E760B9
MAYVLVACQVLLGVVFAVSAMTKPVGWKAFVSSLRSLRLLPGGRGAAAAAAAVVAAEAVCVGAVAVWPRPGFALVVLMLVAFTGAVALSLRRGIRTPCRCFGASTTPLGRVHLVRNTLLGAVALTGWGAASPQAGTTTVAGAAVAVLAGVAGAVVLIALDDLVVLFAEPVRSA